MIVRCTHCNGQMKLDEAGFPDKPLVKVRCPHCQGIGYVEHQPAETSSAEDDPAVQAAGDAYDTTAEFRSSELAAAAKSYDPSLPADAFKDFHFPAELEDDPQARGAMKTGVRIILWAAASLAVIAFFALIVNIILPGPGGGEGMLRAVQSKQDTSPPDAGGRPTLPSPTDRGRPPLGK